MKAFLSHSSHDKPIVENVFQALGAASCVYDAESFEDGKRSADEIFNSLERTDLFVLFVSKHSLASKWVQHELRIAHDRYASGHLRGFQIFILDESAHHNLPAWLSSVHCKKTRNPSVIMRRIRSRLIEQDTEQAERRERCIGREDQIREFASALSAPSDKSPSVLAVAGWPGIGRRTLARKALSDIYPYLPKEQPEILIPGNASVDDFYRILEDATAPAPLAIWKDQQRAFASLSEDEKILSIVSKLHDLHNDKEVLFIIDDGGMLEDSGDYQPWLRNVILSLDSTVRPYAVLIQRQRLPALKRVAYPKLYQISAGSLSDHDMRTLVGLMLREEGLTFSGADLDELVPYLGGHPLNTRFAVQYASQYGLMSLLRDKGDLIQYKVGRAAELLLRMTFEQLETELLVMLSRYKLMRADYLADILDRSDDTLVRSLRRLEDRAIVERVASYHRVAPFLSEAIPRDFAGALDESWHKAVTGRIEELVGSLTDDEDVPLPVIDAAIVAKFRIRSHAQRTGWVGEFVLPSHFLFLAREAYDSQEHALTVTFCREALQRAGIMTPESKIETSRLMGLSLARLGPKRDGEFFKVLHDLEELGKVRPAARRHCHFLRGFHHRLNGKLDLAEGEYKKAYALNRGNFHVLRELAQVLANQGRYAEAEEYGRAALERAPTNPFILDCMCDIIIGKAISPVELTGDKELQSLMSDLKEYSEREGRHFFENRNALYLYKLGNREEALRFASEAVEKSPARFGAYVTRAFIRIGCGQAENVREDLEALRKISSDERTGEGKTSRFIIDKIEIMREAALGNLGHAKRLIEKYGNIPQYVKKDLQTNLAKTIRLEGAHADPDLMEWAERILR